jgi:peptide-methionine (R)-S-oxide reductase
MRIDSQQGDDPMTRRDWLGLLSSLGLASSVSAQPSKPGAATAKIEPLVLTDAEWKKRLTPAQYNVLREEGTERAFTSPLNDEKRQGTFHCAGCDLALFSSQMKYDSGTGWPSFFTTLPGVFGTKRDFKHVLPRTEYHCTRCGGHHGHVFDDGPRPGGLRYCNNGVALKFVAGAA